MSLSPSEEHVAARAQVAPGKNPQSGLAQGLGVFEQEERQDGTRISQGR